MTRSTMVFLLSLVTLLGCASESEQPEVLLTYATPYPPGHPFSRADQRWMDEVSTQSNGRIGFRTFWGGALISSDMSMLELRHGVVDIGLITPIYSRGGAHALRTQAGFYGGVKDIADQVALYKCLASEFSVFNQELHGLKVLAVQGGNLPVIITRFKPVQTLDDLTGMRLRVQTEAVEVLRSLGADPVNMPMGEVYSALAKGVIDGVVAPADTVHTLHFSEVANHMTLLTFSRGAYPARAMSEDAWQRLPSDLQSVITSTLPVWEAALASELIAANNNGLAFGKEQGMTYHTVAADVQQRFDQLYNRIALQEAQKLAQFGVDGERIFATAQHIVQAGLPVSCEVEVTP